MGARPPRLDGDEIALAISKLSREPFQEVLTHLLEAAPDVEDVHAFAKRYPDRWAQAVAILARLGGYHDKLQIDATVSLDVARMSDAELLHRLGEIEEGLAALEADNVDEAASVVPFKKLPAPAKK